MRVRSGPNYGERVKEEGIPKLFEALRGGLAQTRRRERGFIAGEVWDKLRGKERRKRKS